MVHVLYERLEWYHLVGQVPHTGLFSSVSGEKAEKPYGSEVIFVTHH